MANYPNRTDVEGQIPTSGDALTKELPDLANDPNQAGAEGQETTTVISAATAAAAELVPAAKTEHSDQLSIASDALAKELPDLAINSSAVQLLIAEARVVLHTDLGGIWRSLSGSTEIQNLTPATWKLFFDAFAAYAMQILKRSEPLIETPDVETHLEVVRARVIPSIIRWLEPEPRCWEEKSRPMLEDVIPSGEWERWMERTYRFFRADTPPVLVRAEAEFTVFVYRIQTALRYQPRRQVFRRKIENALEGEMVLIEAQVRRRLPNRKTTQPGSPETSSRKRGFPAQTEDHRKVAAVVKSTGRAWRSQLPEICVALNEVKANFPTALKEKHSCESWLDVSDLVATDAGLREQVTKYIEYRLKVVSRKVLEKSFGSLG